jgi:hypothetical protein
MTELDQLKSRLKTEIQKIIAAGHLRPGCYNAGQFNDAYPDLVDYFDNPGDTLYTFERVYPFLSPGLQLQVKTYLQNELDSYFDPTLYSYMGWADGVSREAMPLPPEVEEHHSPIFKGENRQVPLGPGSIPSKIIVLCANMPKLSR